MAHACDTCGGGRLVHCYRVKQLGNRGIVSRETRWVCDPCRVKMEREKIEFTDGWGEEKCWPRYVFESLKETE